MITNKLSVSMQTINSVNSKQINVTCIILIGSLVDEFPNSGIILNKIGKATP